MSATSKHPGIEEPSGEALVQAARAASRAHGRQGSAETSACSPARAGRPGAGGGKPDGPSGRARRHPAGASADPRRRPVSRLAALGLVERRAEPDDARVVARRAHRRGRGQGRRPSASIWATSRPSLPRRLRRQRSGSALRKLLRKVARNLAEINRRRCARPRRRRRGAGRAPSPPLRPSRRAPEHDRASPSGRTRFRPKAGNLPCASARIGPRCAALAPVKTHG